MSCVGTVDGAITCLAKALQKAGIDDAMREARLITAMGLGIDRARLALALQDPIGNADLQMLLETAGPRLEGRPLSHVLGQRAFYNHDFRVTPDVLDPRPDTETLVDAALARPFRRVLDLGTGSGAILLSLLDGRPDACGLGTDISEAALGIARVNAARLRVQDRSDFLLSDWFAQVEGGFDLIVSNPPYIALDEMDALAPELAFEPRMALTDEGDGLSAYRVIVPGAGGHLRPGGWLMVEIGWRQGPAAGRMFADAGFADIDVLPDLDGRDRVVQGRWPG